MHLSLDLESGLALHGSRELLGQALANLVDNALKYGAPNADVDGGESQSEKIALLVLSARRHGNFVEITVADRGPGIAAGDRSRVQDRFVRLEDSRSRPGSGLGLALAAAVARLHKGRLLVEDNDPGLRATLVLPSPARTPPLLAPPRIQAEAGAAA